MHQLRPFVSAAAAAAAFVCQCTALAGGCRDSNGRCAAPPPRACPPRSTVSCRRRRRRRRDGAGAVTDKHRLMKTNVGSSCFTTLDRRPDGRTDGRTTAGRRGRPTDGPSSVLRLYTSFVACASAVFHPIYVARRSRRRRSRHLTTVSINY